MLGMGKVRRSISMRRRPSEWSSAIPEIAGLVVRWPHCPAHNRLLLPVLPNRLEDHTLWEIRLAVTPCKAILERGLALSPMRSIPQTHSETRTSNRRRTILLMQLKLRISRSHSLGRSSKVARQWISRTIENCGSKTRSPGSSTVFTSSQKILSTFQSRASTSAAQAMKMFKRTDRGSGLP